MFKSLFGLPETAEGLGFFSCNSVGNCFPQVFLGHQNVYYIVRRKLTFWCFMTTLL